MKYRTGQEEILRCKKSPCPILQPSKKSPCPILWSSKKKFLSYTPVFEKKSLSYTFRSLKKVLVLYISSRKKHLIFDLNYFSGKVPMYDDYWSETFNFKTKIIYQEVLIHRHKCFKNYWSVSTEIFREYLIHQCYEPKSLGYSDTVPLPPPSKIFLN